MRLTFLFALVLGMSSLSYGASGTFRLDGDLWARPRSGAAIVAMQPVADAVRQLLFTNDGKLVLRYPGEEEGRLWAQELRGWLISLGIESQRIDMQPGSQAADAIELVVQSGSSHRP